MEENNVVEYEEVEYEEEDCPLQGQDGSTEHSGSPKEQVMNETISNTPKINSNLASKLESDAEEEVLPSGLSPNSGSQWEGLYVSHVVQNSC